jgi:hypothetical protein
MYQPASQQGNALVESRFHNFAELVLIYASRNRRGQFAVRPLSKPKKISKNNPKIACQAPEAPKPLKPKDIELAY